MSSWKWNSLMEAYYTINELTGNVHNVLVTKETFAVYTDSSTLYSQVVIIDKDGHSFYLQAKNVFREYVKDLLKTETNTIEIVNDTIRIYQYEGVFLRIKDTPENNYKQLIELNATFKNVEREVCEKINQLYGR